uniref:Glutaredoxin domain-containing protein n=1 Tax=Noccaea caerulescens TaxID=107243 RepID=A0A1J3C716_NOCCA
MGCTSSKQVKANVVADVYKPPPSSFAVFDINAIEEPWLKFEQEDDDEKPTRAITVLDTLDDDDDDDDKAPKTWDEVSKTMETHLKPAAVKQPSEVDSVKPPATPPRRLPRKSASFHTLDELESRARKDMAAQNPRTTRVTLKKTESMSELRPEFTRTESARTESTQSRSVKENIFVLRDRERREREGNKKPVMNWDPLREFPEKCPPGGGDGLVVYTTSLQGVRRTYEDCMRVRAIMEQQGVVMDERDVALDAGVLSELKELLQDEATVAPPRVFVKGRYLGGSAEVTAMNENGKLGRVLRWARVERVGEEGRHTCEGCGGARWLPCFDCGGSCKVAAAKGEKRERCGKCNENGLIRCPVCFVH